MMIRELNEIEKGFTNKGITKEKKELIEFQEALDYTNATELQQTSTWIYEDSVREYNRKQQTRKLQNIKKQIQAQMGVCEASIAEMEKQLVEGVESNEDNEQGGSE